MCSVGVSVSECKLFMGMHVVLIFVLQAEDGIRDLVRSRGLGDVYKRQELAWSDWKGTAGWDRLGPAARTTGASSGPGPMSSSPRACLLYTSDAADERSSVDLGGRRFIKKKKIKKKKKKRKQRNKESIEQETNKARRK